MPKPLRVPLEALSPGMRLLTAPVARYVSRVHRLGPGAQLLVFDPASGTEAEATLCGGEARGVYCEVGVVRPSGYRPQPICLMQGLGKGEKPDLVIRDATALGVDALVLVGTERTVAQLSAERGSARLDRWKRIATEAARQSGRGNLPSIFGPLPLAEALAEASQARRIVLTAGAPPLFEQLLDWDGGQALALLVGPEGGLSPSEARLADATGFLPASLGGTILRTELAGVAALGALVALSAARALG